MIESETALGGGNTGHARIGLDGHAQGAPEGLEHGLGLMVRVVAAQAVDMRADRGVIDEPLEELAHEIDIELADRAAREGHLEHEAGAAGQIDDYAGERLVEWDVSMTVAPHALLIADSLRQRLTKGDANVLDGVVGIDVQIALRLDLEVDHAVAGDLVEHVIEEADAGRQLGRAAAVEIDLDSDFRFEGVALNFGAAHVTTATTDENGGHDTIPGSPDIHTRSPMSRYWSDVVKSLTPYVPGEQPKLPNLIKLNTNENPYGPSPKVIEAIRRQADDRLRLYSDPEGSQLKAAVAAHFGNVEPGQVFLGNGSDEVLGHAFLALLKHKRPILFPDITYSFYPVYCGLYGIDYINVPLTEQFEIRADDYLKPNGGIIFPNPNAPTGRVLPLADIERIVAGNPDSVVVIDEAYVDFGAESAVALINKYPNLLVVQTLSKSRSLAGLRVGFAVGNASLIEALERVKNSFNSYPLDRLALAGATAAIEDHEWFDRTRKAVIKSREKLSTDLAALGFEVLPSSANFVFARHPGRDAGELAKSLRERSIILRHFRQPRIEQFLRITIGTNEECDALVSALREILSA